MSQRTTTSPLKRAVLAAAFLALLTPTASHSWVEQLQRVATNGTMLSTVGYQRAFVGRGDPGFKGDISDDLRQLPPNGRTGGAAILASDYLCSPQQQKVGTYSSKYPMLTSAAGDYVAMRYEENGHVTIPATQANKPKNRGTVFIYGTDAARDNDTLLAIHGVWTADGSGGDKRGRLLATRNFDDQQCYQINDGAISMARQSEFKKVAENPQGMDLWCQNDVQLPSDLAANSLYTMYWVWDWPTLSKNDSMPGDAGVTVTTPEIYTSCMDLQIVDPCDASLGDVKSPLCSSGNSTTNKLAASIANSFSKGQDLNSAAILLQLENNYDVEDPSVGTGNVGSAAGSGTTSAAVPVATTLVTSKIASSQVPVATVTVTEGVTTVTVTETSGGARVAATSTSSTSSTPAAVSIPQTPGVAPTVSPTNSGKSKRNRKGARAVIGEHVDGSRN